MSRNELRPDIEAAKSRMRNKLGGGREIKKLVGYLWDGETVERMTTGQYGKGQGLVVMTDRRLLFVQDGMTSKTTEDFPYSRVSSVSFSSGMALGTLTVFASGNKAEIKNMNKDDGRGMADALRGRLAEAPGVSSAPPTGASAAPVDVADQLGKLAALRDAGVLTDEEFAAQKAKILG